MRTPPRLSKGTPLTFDDAREWARKYNETGTATPELLDFVLAQFKKGIAPALTLRAIGVKPADWAKWMKLGATGEEPFATVYQRHAEWQAVETASFTHAMRVQAVGDPKMGIPGNPHLLMKLLAQSDEARWSEAAAAEKAAYARRAGELKAEAKYANRGPKDQTVKIEFLTHPDAGEADKGE